MSIFTDETKVLINGKITRISQDFTICHSLYSI
jgi:hypothetical protein